MTAGDQGTLVFIHGSGDSAAVWEPLLARLRDFATLAVDLPGHGARASEVTAEEPEVADYAQDVRATLDERGLARVTVIGHSLGGAIALRMAADAPEVVRRLALVGSGARLRVAPRFLEDARAGGAHGSATLTELAFAPGHEEMARAYHAGRQPAAPEATYRDLAACDRFDMLAEVGGVSQPALAIVGAEDRLTPPKYAQFLAERMPRCQQVVIPDAGHYAHLEQPDAVAQALRAWLAANPPD